MLPVVNGVQRDGTLEVCRDLERRQPSIRTECIEECGWGAAVRHGLGKARGDLLCYANSARTTADDLLLMLLYGSIHHDCVIKANRKIREKLWRRLGSLLYNLECRHLFDLPYWDINGTPKVFHRVQQPRLMSLTRNNDLIDLEFLAICRRENYRVLEVPVLSSTRHSGRSTTNMRSAYRMYKGALEMRRRLSQQ